MAKWKPLFSYGLAFDLASVCAVEVFSCFDAEDIDRSDVAWACRIVCNGSRLMQAKALRKLG
jgi:hypothetical protein